VTGLLVDANDSEAVAAAMVKVLRDPAAAKAMGEDGRAWVESEMNWTRAANEFEEVMKEFFPRVTTDRREAV
jgi:phosphatidylinositol alpha-1,6-mannosyltransferase